MPPAAPTARAAQTLLAAAQERLRQRGLTADAVAREGIQAVDARLAGRRPADGWTRLDVLDWQHVPASLVGALVPWALGGGQRQSLGAWFTPPAIADDLAAATLGTAHRPGVSDADPAAQLRRLRALRILDPACGAGDLLAAALRWMVQRERDLLRALGDADGRPPQVHAGQLRGLDANPLACAAARVVLRHAASRLGCAGDPQLVVQDALLAKGPAPQAPVWPDADVVVSNPPFIGSKRLRVALGDARVESLWAAWPSVPRQADLALFWWSRCAALLHAGALQRAGFITTSSIRQPHNRRVVQRWLDAGLALLYADPDRAWSSADASVRVALTVLGPANEAPAMMGDRPVARIHADLSDGPDLSRLAPLPPNTGRCFMGVTPVGRGFSLRDEQVLELGFSLADPPPVLRPTANARELLQGGRRRWLIDLHGLRLEEARRQWPRLVAHLERTVRPGRERNRRRSYRERWWLLGEPRPALRTAAAGLKRLILTPITSRHRIFCFASPTLLPDCQLMAIASADAAVLGVLSSRIHRVFAAATASRMGVGNDLRWRSGTCFEPFPMPDLAQQPARRERIASLAEAMDQHRADAQQRGASDGRGAPLARQHATLERWRAAEAGGPPLSAEDRRFAREAGTGHLHHLLRQLDDAVSEAYGWDPDRSEVGILESLVDLHAHRMREPPPAPGGPPCGSAT